MEIGGGTPEGARLAAARLIEAGARALVSFGLAGGLDPALRPGAIVIPSEVWIDGRIVRTDAPLTERLGGPTPSTHLAGDRIAVTAGDKAALRRATGAASIDLETGAIARAAEARGLGFAVLRAICDPAERTLPPAALVALDAQGTIGIPRLILSLLRRPGQIGALLDLAADAAAARRALLRHVRTLG